jgi:hypothetical protein
MLKATICAGTVPLGLRWPAVTSPLGHSEGGDRWPPRSSEAFRHSCGAESIADDIEDNDVGSLILLEQ